MSAALPVPIAQSLQRIDAILRRQGAVIPCITSLMEYFMANMADLLAEVATLKQAVIDDETADAALVDTLNAKIAELEAGADTQTAIDALKDVAAQLKPPGGTTQEVPPA